MKRYEFYLKRKRDKYTTCEEKVDVYAECSHERFTTNAQGPDKSSIIFIFCRIFSMISKRQQNMHLQQEFHILNAIILSEKEDVLSMKEASKEIREKGLTQTYNMAVRLRLILFFH